MTFPSNPERGDSTLVFHLVKEYLYTGTVISSILTEILSNGMRNLLDDHKAQLQRQRTRSFGDFGCAPPLRKNLALFFRG